MKAEFSKFTLERPKDLGDALQRLAASSGDLRLLAGGTDVCVVLNAGMLRPGRWLDLWPLDELRGIRLQDGYLVIGALTTHSSVRADALVRQHFPMVAEAAGCVGARAIQNRGTLGGNLVNGSPAADTAPALLCHDAQVGLRSVGGQRWVALDQFFTGYRSNCMRPDELLEAIRMPLASSSQGASCRFVKVGTRAAQAISKVVAAFMLGLDSAGVVTRARLAYGSVAPIPLRLRRVEDYLVGSKLDRLRVEGSADMIRSSVSPIDDVRSTERYRRVVCSRIWERFLSENT